MNKPENLSRQLKLRRVGNSVGIILPKELLSAYGLEAGDAVSVSKAPDGIHIAVRDPGFDEQIAEARKLMKQYRNALAELAK